MRSAQRVFLVTLVLSVGAPLAAQVPSRSRDPFRPETYGTSFVSYVAIPSIEFFPPVSSTAYDQYFGRFSTNCAVVGCFTAALHLPAGAKVVYLELDFHDTNASSYVGGSLVKCDHDSVICTFSPAAGAGPADCIKPGFICSGTAFAGGNSLVFADLTPDGVTVDNLNYSYRLYAGNTSADSSTNIDGMIVGYVLQVSPAPVTATFTDVPTSDFAFQFIEAFNKAGITVGCNTSPPKFCPDRNVTRREMAVFFAKALGLQFP